MSLPMVGLQSMLKEGSKHMSGVDEAVLRNVEACKNLSKITRTSLGPNGMNKMVINHLDKLFVTNDAATIIKELEVEHPAAKLLVMASKMQEQEIGDGTNLTVVFAGELLHQAAGLLEQGLHPSEVIAGYQKAQIKAQELLDTLVVRTVSNLRDEEELARSIRTAIGSKQYGRETELSRKVAKACLQVMPKNPKNFNVDNVRVAKILGGALSDTLVVNGVVQVRNVEGSVSSIKDAKVAVYSCALENATTETKGTVLMENSEDLLNYTKGEEKNIEDAIQRIADAGANVIVTFSTVSDMALHFIERHKMLVLKVLSKFELRRLCRTIGAQPVSNLRRAPKPEELGHCDEVVVEEISSTKVTIFRNHSETSRISTLVLRSSTKNSLDDLERAVDDGVNVVKAMTRDSRFVAGGGACEIELARKLASFGEKAPGMDQYAIKKYAEAFEVVPRTLAENAGTNSIEFITSFYACHEKAQPYHGVDLNSLETGVTSTGTADAIEPFTDMVKAEVFDLLATKSNAIRLATEAACTVLNVDQIIMAKPAGGPKPPSQGMRDALDDQM